ncbi:MAG: ABC transporter permease subunit [Oscillospiraceae bacterium]
MSKKNQESISDEKLHIKTKNSFMDKSILKNADVYLMMLPVLIHIFVFCYIPMYGVIIAFQNYSPGKPFLSFDGSVDWVGLQHFTDFVTNPYFWRLIKNTLVFSGLYLAIGFWMPIAFALVLNEVHVVKYKKFVQTASYLPHFISSVVVAGMVLSFINSEGVINQVRMLVGTEAIPFNIEPSYFPVIYTITNIWQNFGWGSILYLSAMSAIDPGQYEAARLDGAGRFKQMWHVTLPAIRPTIAILLIFDIGGILNTNSEMILLLYNSAVYETADVIGTYVYRAGLVGGEFSYGSAVGLFTSAIGFGLVYLANVASRKLSGYSLW